MKTIQLEIEDNSLDMFLSLIGSLKEGIVKRFDVKEDTRDAKFYEAETYFKNAYDDIKSGKSKTVPLEYGIDELDNYIDSIK